jgi:hypothetical protein
VSLLSVDKHEAEWGRHDQKKNLDPLPLRHIAAKYLRQISSQATAISAEIAGETIALRDIVRVRNSRRRELRSILDSRQKTVDALLQLKKGQSIERTRVSAPTAKPATKIKRYRNE